MISSVVGNVAFVMASVTSGSAPLLNSNFRVKIRRASKDPCIQLWSWQQKRCNECAEIRVFELPLEGGQKGHKMLSQAETYCKESVAQRRVMI